MAQPCCLIAGIGFDFPTPSASPGPLPQLLGLSDLQLQEQMAKGHPYEFNMGQGLVIPFQNYKKAAKALMERNLPDILHDRQTRARFVPPSNLSKMPHIVDMEEFENKKKSLTTTELAFLEMKPGREDINNKIGDIVEKELSDALKKFYDEKNVSLSAGAGKLAISWLLLCPIEKVGKT